MKKITAIGLIILFIAGGFLFTTVDGIIRGGAGCLHRIKDNKCGFNELLVYLLTGLIFVGLFLSICVIVIHMILKHDYSSPVIDMLPFRVH